MIKFVWETLKARVGCHGDLLTSHNHWLIAFLLFFYRNMINLLLFAKDKLYF
jgi:hypothetical protein